MSNAASTLRLRGGPVFDCCSSPVLRTGRDPSTARRSSRHGRASTPRRVRGNLVRIMRVGHLQRVFATSIAAATLPVMVGVGCGSRTTLEEPPIFWSGGDAEARDASTTDAFMREASVLDANRDVADFPQKPDASCAVTVEAPDLLASPHVPIGTDVSYNSNPPSSGPHYAIWAAFQAFSTPVDRRYYVHDLEHGAIVLLYKCERSDGCPEIVAGLQAVSDAIPNDPICTDVRVRTVITPDPLLDVPVAAAAWGFTYKATCLDIPSLKTFALEHYGQAPEQECGNGVTTF